MLLTACNTPQRASSRSIWADRLSSVGLINCLLVGRMTSSVKGITKTCNAPATTHQNVAPVRSLPSSGSICLRRARHPKEQVQTSGSEDGSQMPLRILIADDSKMIRRTLRSFLEANPNWQVCDEAFDGREAVQKTKHSSPTSSSLISQCQ
jgi:PleD family two-component response regulator